MSDSADRGHRRAAIDAGETGDKVPAEDPAVSPLGTDAETGGAAVSDQAARRDRDQQKRIARRISRNTVPIAAQSDIPAAPKAQRVGLLFAAALLVLTAIGIALGVAGLPPRP